MAIARDSVMPSGGCRYRLRSVAYPSSSRVRETGTGELWHRQTLWITNVVYDLSGKYCDRTGKEKGMYVFI